MAGVRFTCQVLPYQISDRVLPPLLPTPTQGAKPTQTIPFSVSSGEVAGGAASAVRDGPTAPGVTAAAAGPPPPVRAGRPARARASSPVAAQPALVVVLR